jgi:hypothetical protein
MFPFYSSSDSVDYTYDDTGRLVRVVNSLTDTRILYHYDKVGNLKAVYKEENSPAGTSPPVIEGIDIDTLLPCETYYVIITGQNFLTTTDILSDNPDVTVKIIASIDTVVSAVITVSCDASSGQATLTVTTAYGSDTISVNVEEGYFATSLPVSVSIGDVSSETRISASPVSVEFPVVSEGRAVSQPVSIEWLELDDAVTVSTQVSVEICSDSAVRIAGASPVYYSTLQSAYDAAIDGDTIESQAVEVTENLDLNSNKSITFIGGYNCDFSEITGYTSINGSITINDGTVVMENFKVK